MTRASKARAHLHGSRYIYMYMPSIVTSVLEFSTRHDAVLLFDIFKMGIGHGSGHLNALIYHILKLFCLLRYSIKTLKSKKLYCKKKTDFSFLLTPIVFCCLNFQRCTFLCYFAKGGESGDLMYWKWWKLRNQGRFIWNLLTYGIYLFFCGISKVIYTVYPGEYLKGGE